MRMRIISGIAALVFLAIIVWAKPFIMGIAVCTLSIIGIYEIYKAMGNKGYKPIYAVGYIFSATLLIYTFYPVFQEYFKQHEVNQVKKMIMQLISQNVLMNFLLWIVLFVSFCVLIFANKKYCVTDIAITLFGIMYVPFLFSFIIFTRNLEYGIFYIWFMFIGAWGTDTTAYFGGVLFGKRKILPEISPKKTWFGFYSGIIGCTILTVIFGTYMASALELEKAHTIHFVILGILNGVVSQIGDWAASAIKRFCGVKDFGNIMPGHGGVMDRCDSLLFVAPIVYFFILLLIR